MNLLFKAALRNSKHWVLALITFLSLLLLTVANQAEMFSYGILANTGADFFELFGKDRVSKGDIEKRWNRIDVKRQGYISKKDASLYLAKKKSEKSDFNLNAVLNRISSKLDLQENFLKFVLLFAVVAIFKAIWLFFSRYAAQILSIRISRDLRQQFFEHIQFLPMSFYNDYNMGSLTARAVGDAGQIASSLNSCITNYMQTPFIIASSLFFCIYSSWQLSLIIFIGLPMVIIPVVILTRRVKKVARQIQKNQETFTSVLLDFLAGIHTVKVFAMEQFTRKKYQEQNDRMADLEIKSAKYALLTRPVLHMITTACMVAVVTFGLYTLHMTIPQIIIFIGCLYLFYEPVKKFAEENSNIQRGVVASERLFQVLHLNTYAKDDGKIVLKDFKDCIEFDNVSFSYKEDPVLTNLSFTIKKGQTIAIVGPTGSGKTTIVQLLPRLFDVEKGQIRIDGIPLSDYTVKSLRDNISYVPQKAFLFYDTVSENISFGRNFSKEEIEKATRMAHADEFVVNLPQKYDTVLLEAGKSLSGGQQQRLTIARALIKNAPILIMDEATSSLDVISENRIKMAMDELRGHVTQIIIAHRLSTIEHADKIIYLDRGQKIAEGTKEELLRTSPPFKTMWDTFHLLGKVQN